MNDKVRLGILGCGMGGVRHVKSALKNPECELVAVCDSDPSKLSSINLGNGSTATCTTMEELFSFDLDAVCIAVPNFIHLEVIEECAKRGLNFLIEKPALIDRGSIESVQSNSRLSALRSAVVAQHRFAPQLGVVRRMLKEGRLGKVLFINGFIWRFRPTDFYRNSWKGDVPKAGGGALMLQGVHVVDVILWLNGAARVLNAHRINSDRHRFEDQISVQVEYENGGHGTVQATTSAYPGISDRIEIACERACIFVSDDNVVRVETQDLEIKKEISLAVEGEGPTNFSEISLHDYQLRSYLKFLKSGIRDETLCSLDEGISAVKLIIDSYASSGGAFKS